MSSDSKVRRAALPLSHDQLAQNNVGLKTMALTAMANLVGQATRKQFREEVERMPESSTLSSATSNEGCDKHKVWHVTVGSYIYIYIYG